MQFNSHATNQDLVSLLNDLVGTDENIYPLVAKTRDMNTANRTIWTWIHEAYGGWQYDDANNTSDFPSATASLVSGQKDYGLPSDAMTVRAVEVKNTAGVWNKIQPLTEEQIRDFQAENEFMKTSSQPLYYTIKGNSVNLFPAPNYSQSASLRVSYDRETSAFVSTDTTKTPGFASVFHEAVAYGAGAIFSSYKSIPQMVALQNRWLDYEQRIKKFYSNRYHELFPSRMTVVDATEEFS